MPFGRSGWKYMQSPDVRRLKHIRDYCLEVEKTIRRYGNDFSVFDKDADYQRSVSFCILQIGELSGGLSPEYRKATAHRMQGGPSRVCGIWWRTITAA